MAGKLAHKVAVVTGASKGIGAGIATLFAREGASVVVNYASSRAGADRVVAEIKAAGGQALAVQADVSNPADIARLFAETKKAFGRVDVLVNNAGVYEFKNVGEITPEHFNRLFDLNVLGLLLTTQEAVKHMPATGGSVINISSQVSTFLPPGTAVYSATKAAVDALTVVLSKELGPRKVRVNAINPSMVQTEGVAAAGFGEGEFRAFIEQRTPLGRIGQVSDIAPAAVYFASDDSSWTSGQTLFIGGGVW